MPGSTAQTNKFHTFYLQQRAEQSVTWADIKVNHPLDYESIKEYNLTIRVEVRLPHARKCLRKLNSWFRFFTTESCEISFRAAEYNPRFPIVRYILTTYFDTIQQIYRHNFI